VTAYDPLIAPDDDVAVEQFPWPPGEGESIVSAFGRTWAGASLRPRTFFRALPDSGSIGAALLYYVPLGIAVAGADLFWTMVRGPAALEREEVLGRIDLGGIDPVVGFLLSPVVLLASLVVSAAATHLLLRLFGGANRDFGVTTRVFAYCYSPQILGVVPVAGSVMGFVWMVVVAVIGLREAHETTLGRVLPAVMIPVVLALIALAIAAFMAVAGSVILH
jgi:hypothetical protein